ncbi:vascular cell adhesion protein 1 isoform X2 [Ambystoma mexicanum]|uniref:vascular cell adhesion protein 1 isoform X2 n=1 Tax=Ambystoma mexicanum TaxID=8296 RepID=UPI0037E9899D
MKFTDLTRTTLALHLLLQGIMNADGFEATLLPNTWTAAPLGGSLVLSCSVTGCEPGKHIDFRWSVNGDASVGGPVNTLGSQSNLTLSPITFENAQTYICKPSCGSGRPQKTTEVYVYAFSKDPVISSTALVAGTPGYLTCEVPEVFPSHHCTLKLTRGGQHVEEKNYEDEERSQEGKTTTLVLRQAFTPSVEDDGAEVTCMSEMSLGDLGITMEPKKRQSKTTLTVSYAPQNVIITSESPSNMLIEGDRLNLSCVSKSKPWANITWTKQSAYSLHSLREGNSLFIKSLQTSDSGVYACEARNEVGRNSSSIEIIVQGPPRSTNLTVVPDGIVQEGDNVVISCTSLGVPTPHITLRKKNDAEDVVLTPEDGSYRILTVQREDSGIYECESTNHLGKQVINVTLFVQVPPPGYRQLEQLKKSTM